MTEVMVPTWDTADRMRKALRSAGIGVGEMAAYLGVTPSTVSTWINGKFRPNLQTLRLWSIRTGVPLEWLQTGDVRHEGLEPPTRWLTARGRAA